MASEGSRKKPLPTVLAALAGGMATMLSILSILPARLTTISGAVPSMVIRDIPAALAMAISGVLILVSLSLAAKGDKKGTSYMTAGVMLSTFVGAVTLMVGTSRVLVSLFTGEILTPAMVLGSGALAGALLMLVSLGAAKRLIACFGDPGPGGGR